MRSRTSLIAALWALFTSACTATLEGAKVPPRAWLADSVSSRCELLAGTYRVDGEPAPDNAHSWLYNVIWPQEGSLVSFIELGANAPSRSGISSVRIAIDASGR